MKTVDGVILILSCQKYLNTRLKKFKLSKDEYLNWKVFYVIGDLSLDKPYEMRDNNYLYIKCEDSYIHLLKKLALSIKYVNEIYNIKEGILRCGDDLIFNENRLVEFLQIEKKYDYWGYHPYKGDCLYDDNKLKKNTIDFFMIDYYKKHNEDFLNKNHGLLNYSLIKLKKYCIRPKIHGAVGIIYYISKKSIEVIIKELQRINFDIFHYEEFSKSYPYTIEDIGIAYMMYKNKIKFINSNLFVKSKNSMAKHTNLFK